MAKKIKVIREFKTKKDMFDLEGIKISKGTILHVITEGPIHPTENYRVCVVRVDNGTGYLDLMPETAVRLPV